SPPQTATTGPHNDVDGPDGSHRGSTRHGIHRHDAGGEGRRGTGSFPASVGGHAGSTARSARGRGSGHVRIRVTSQGRGTGPRVALCPPRAVSPFSPSRPFW